MDKDLLLHCVLSFLIAFFVVIVTRQVRLRSDKYYFHSPRQNVMKCRFFPYDNPKETIYVRFVKGDFPGLYKEFDNLSYEDFGNLEKNIYQEIRMYLDCMKDGSDA